MPWRVCAYVFELQLGVLLQNARLSDWWVSDLLPYFASVFHLRTYNNGVVSASITIVSILSALSSVNSLAAFSGCDTVRAVQENEVFYIQSPGYGSYYKPNTNCRWRLNAPTGFQLYMNCYDVILPSSTNCAVDRIEVSLNGNALLSGAKRYCGLASFIVQSTANKLTVGLRSPKASSGGRFRCQIVAKPPPCDCGRRRTVKIVNGMPTLVNEFPMVAGLVSSSAKKVFCGATIISNRHALTAAHCLTGQRITNTALLVGDHDISTGADTPYSTLMAISTFTIHNGYRAQSVINDIAIVRTRDQIVFNAGVGPACLPWRWSTASFDGVSVEAVGWGTVDYGAPASLVLRKANLNVVSYETCRQILSSSGITKNQICTYADGRDSCQYDSGGPVLYTNPNTEVVFHVGVISYGVACASSYPSVNTRTTSYLSWIRANTVGIKYCEK
ncbi:venom serine protease-like [Armigeres subalbatus]|uniref:venom serine protease-like n=1 Tax=Armigeres subalbatus TaxID=124917 RepID=UPI002ED2F000